MDQEKELIQKIAKDPQDLETAGKLLDLYVEKDELDKFMEMLKTHINSLKGLMEEKKNYGLLFALKASECSANEEYEKAEELFSKAIEICPFEDSIYHFYGKYLLEYGNEYKGIGCFERAYNLDTENLGNIGLLASAYEESQDFWKAIKYYREYINLSIVSEIPDGLPSRKRIEDNIAELEIGKNTTEKWFIKTIVNYKFSALPKSGRITSKQYTDMAATLVIAILGNDPFEYFNQSKSNAISEHIKTLRTEDYNQLLLELTILLMFRFITILPVKGVSNAGLDEFHNALYNLLYTMKLMPTAETLNEFMLTARSRYNDYYRAYQIKSAVSMYKLGRAICKNFFGEQEEYALDKSMYLIAYFSDMRINVEATFDKYTIKKGWF